MKLYIDSTQQLIIGIVDAQFSWASYKCLEVRKRSQHIHQEIYQALREQNADVHSIEEIIQASGPGSYTGMRLAETISQVFQWQGTKVSNFYHFEIPQMLGLTDKPWFSKAYKGELFVYRPRKTNPSIELIKEKGSSLNENNAYTYHSTNHMIKNNSKTILTKVSQRGVRLNPYYYRNAQKEFPLTKNK